MYRRAFSQKTLDIFGLVRRKGIQQNRSLLGSFSALHQAAEKGDEYVRSIGASQRFSPVPYGSRKS